VLTKFGRVLRWWHKVHLKCLFPRPNEGPPGHHPLACGWKGGGGGGVPIRTIGENALHIQYSGWWSWSADLKNGGRYKSTLPKEIRSRQWLISERSRQNRLKTSYVPPQGFPDGGLWAEIRTLSSYCSQAFLDSVLAQATPWWQQTRLCSWRWPTWSKQLIYLACPAFQP
jgi:hypothetical protein